MTPYRSHSNTAAVLQTKYLQNPYIIYVQRYHSFDALPAPEILLIMDHFWARYINTWMCILHFSYILIFSCMGILLLHTLFIDQIFFHACALLFTVVLFPSCFINPKYTVSVFFHFCFRFSKYYFRLYLLIREEFGYGFVISFYLTCREQEWESRDLPVLHG